MLQVGYNAFLQCFLWFAIYRNDLLHPCRVCYLAVNERNDAVKTFRRDCAPVAGNTVVFDDQTLKSRNCSSPFNCTKITLQWLRVVADKGDFWITMTRNSWSGKLLKYGRTGFLYAKISEC